VETAEYMMAKTLIMT